MRATSWESGCTPGKMSYAEGIEFFVKEGYQTRVNAERETKRGTSDPTYLIYTLGQAGDYAAARGLSETARREVSHCRISTIGSWSRAPLPSRL